jgi:hypothetical protein
MQSKMLFEKLFKCDLSAPGSRDLVKKITTLHPYFSPAQFYRLAQTPAGSAEFEKQAGLTSLLFNNPYWLNWQWKQIVSPGEEKEYAQPAEMVSENAENDDDAAILAGEHRSAETEIGQNNTPSFPPPRTTETMVTPGTSDDMAEENTDNNDDEAEVEIAPMKPMLKIGEAAHLNEKEMPLFEPMHRVDYFASQGIRLSQEVQESDRLGKQLKSFTEWLKTMKKLPGSAQHPQQGITGLVAAMESSILALAENSNREGEVLTEAMAEVFVKQGKAEKAAEVYRKLSLLDPSKTAYFAAKIEQLKST